MFVNIFALLKHLKDLHSAGYRKRLLMCYVWWRMHVLRDGQWGIPKDAMPDDLYPVYCSGMGYVFSTEVAVAMYRVSYYEK
jgi:Galactosyltransferase